MSCTSAKACFPTCCTACPGHFCTELEIRSQTKTQRCKLEKPLSRAATRLQQSHQLKLIVRCCFRCSRCRRWIRYLHSLSSLHIAKARLQKHSKRSLGILLAFEEISDLSLWRTLVNTTVLYVFNQHGTRIAGIHSSSLETPRALGCWTRLACESQVATSGVSENKVLGVVAATHPARASARPNFLFFSFLSSSLRRWKLGGVVLPFWLASLIFKARQLPWPRVPAQAYLQLLER